MAMRFERAGTLTVEEGISLIRSHMRKTRNAQRKRVKVLGQDVALNSLRLYTFASRPPCCSNPECGIRATFFAVEIQTKDGQPVNSHYQLNMYGTTKQGHDVLMTHDHTLARSLGGEDGLSNTTTMCKTCNQKKSVFESQEIERVRGLRKGLPAPGVHPPATLRAAAFLGDFLAMGQAKGMDEASYRRHCDLMGTTLGPPLGRWEDADREHAKVLGLSRVGLRLHQRHIEEAMRPGVELVMEPPEEEFKVDPATLNPILGRHHRRGR